MAVKIESARDFCFRKPLLAEPSARLCRNLFGKVDKDDLQDEYKSSLKKETTEKSKLWDFDFALNVPLPSTRLRWEPVTKGAASFGTGKNSASCTLSTPRGNVPASTVSDPSTQDKVEGNSTSSASLRIIHEEELTTEGCGKTTKKTSPTKAKYSSKVEKRKRETTITEFMKQKKKRRYSDVEKHQKASNVMEPPRARTRLSVSEF